VFLAPLLEAGAGIHLLRVVRTGRALATTIEPAFDSSRRNRGLLGRDRLPDGTALILAPCNAIHTVGMRFSIDVVFADREGRVLKVRRAVGPWRLSGALRGFATIELAAGAIDEAGLECGDVLTVVPAVQQEPSPVLKAPDATTNPPAPE